MTRVLLVDDHALLRDSLRGALEDVGYEVVGEAGDGAQAVDLALQLRPDVVLMDVTMPVLDGIEATRRITTAAKATRVLVLTMHADPGIVGRARAAGAAGFLVKDTPLEGVVAAVARVACGHLVMSPGLAPADAPPGPAADEREALSSREEEVLQLLADGSSPAEVAKALFISPNTVRNHLASIYEKLGAHDRTQAVVEGLRRGVIRLREPAA
jgi:DNA-binding NarL/FixJ family response regulator